MAIYNAANHTIESDDGQTLLARLTPAVRAEQAFEIADYWGGHSKEIDKLNSELRSKESDRRNAEANEQHAIDENRRLNDQLDEARDRIKQLEAELEQKGATAA